MSPTLSLYSLWLIAIWKHKVLLRHMNKVQFEGSCWAKIFVDHLTKFHLINIWYFYSSIEVPILVNSNTEYFNLANKSFLVVESHNNYIIMWPIPGPSQFSFETFSPLNMMFSSMRTRWHDETNQNLDSSSHQ